MPSYRLSDDSVVARTSAASTGWTAFTGLQGVFDFARTQGRPLFFQPGNYDAGPTTVTAANGGGKPLQVGAVPGTVTLRFTGGANFLKIDRQSHVVFQNITFDGQARTLSDYLFERKAFVVIGAGSKDVSFGGFSLS